MQVGLSSRLQTLRQFVQDVGYFVDWNDPELVDRKKREKTLLKMDRTMIAQR
jgi:hypothetical protein